MSSPSSFSNDNDDDVARLPKRQRLLQHSSSSTSNSESFGSSSQDDSQGDSKMSGGDESDVASSNGNGGDERNVAKNNNNHLIPEPVAPAPASYPSSESASDCNNTNSHSSTTSSHNTIKPYAPRLSDYLAAGGTELFRPRPEWLNASTASSASSSSNKRSRKRSRHQQPQQGAAQAAALQQLHQHQQQQQQQQQQHHQLHQVQLLQPQALIAVPLLADPANLHGANNGLLPDNAFADFLVAALVEPSSDEAEEEPARPAAAAAAAASNSNQARRSSSTSNATTTTNQENAAVFGKEKDSALHVAIRDGASDAALSLIHLGAPVTAENAKRVTPLILASQKGLISVVISLLSHGANPLDVTITGSTSLLQASHFGHFDIVTLLLEHGAMMEMANYKNTTPLMRASQEGHEPVVSLLLSRGARVNRRNNEHMSALMLASQRGHSPIVQILLDRKADVDAMTAQKSTSLMLACKREHVQVVEVLVTAGCELQMKDARGRTARDVAVRRNSKPLLKLLEPSKQVELMQRKSRVHRSYLMAKMWSLLQQDRASVFFGGRDVSIHQVFGNEEKGAIQRTDSSLALIRTMKLPAPMVEHIASYMPLPNLWDERLMLITRRCGVDADAAISCALDLIDEVLEEGGFLDACHIAKVTPPTHFDTWDDWRAWGCKHNNLDTIQSTSGRVNALTATLPGMPKLQIGSVSPLPRPMNARDWRSGVCFLQVLAHRSPMLQQVLVQPPFRMPTWVVDQLITVSDIQSLSRRMGTRGAHFEASVAIELVMLASSVVSWYNRELRCCDGQNAAVASSIQQEAIDEQPEL